MPLLRLLVFLLLLTLPPPLPSLDLSRNTLAIFLGQWASNKTRGGPSPCLFLLLLSSLLLCLNHFHRNDTAPRSSSLHRVGTVFSIPSTVFSLETVKSLLSASLACLRKAPLDTGLVTFHQSPRLHSIHAISKFGIFLPNTNQFRLQYV